MLSNKLIYKLTLLAIVPVILSMIFFGILSYSIFKEQLIEERIEDATFLISTSAEEIKNPLYFLELNKLNDIVNHIKKNPNILSVYIMDSSGRVITDGTPENRFYNQTLNDDFSKKSILSREISSEINRDILHVSAPIIISEKIGILRIDFSLRELDQTLINLTGLLGTIGLIIFVVVATIDFSISSSISKPITKLRDAADEIARGNFSAMTDITSKDEIGELAGTFNKMARDLQRSSDDRKRVEEELRRKEEHFRSLIENALDTITVLNIDGTISYESPSVERMLGYKPEELIGKNAFEFIHPEDLPGVMSIINRGIQNPGSTHSAEYRFKHKEGSWHVLESIGKIIDNAELTEIIVNSRDITERKWAEQQIEASLKEKELLLREIHHRVKNNMQIISSLLMLQSQYLKNKKDADIFIDSQNRIESMSLVHEKLYQSRDLAKIDFKEYIEDMTSGLFQSHGVDAGNISLNINVENIELAIDHAIPCGLIINELVTNSLKYAFPDGRKGEIKISLRSSRENVIELVVGDNGIGIPKDLDFRKTESLGLHLVTILAESQLHGEIELDRSNGTEFQIKFGGIK